mgnify:CR=1 FL=1
MGSDKTGDVELGQRIADALRRSGVSRSDLAAALNMSRQQVGHYINGRSMPPLDTLLLIARECGLTLSELLGEVQPAQDPRLTQLVKVAGGLPDDDIETLTNLARRLASERGRVELPQEVEEIAAQLTEPERRALARAIAQRDREDRLKVADESGQYDPDAGALRPPRQGSERARGDRVGES